MSDSDDATWKVISAIAVLAAVALGILWMQARQGTVDVAVADSLRQANTELSSTVEKLRAAPPETVYAAPPSRRQDRQRLGARIRDELSELEAVLPRAASHPIYHRRLRAIRAALDTIEAD